MNKKCDYTMVLHNAILDDVQKVIEVVNVSYLVKNHFTDICHETCKRQDCIKFGQYHLSGEPCSDRNSSNGYYQQNVTSQSISVWKKNK